MHSAVLGALHKLQLHFVFTGNVSTSEGCQNLLSWAVLLCRPKAEMKPMASLRALSCANPSPPDHVREGEKLGPDGFWPLL